MRFVESHPHGRYVVSDLRGKELVMRLMSHPDPEVQTWALLCVQKIMLPKVGVPLCVLTRMPGCRPARAFGAIMSPRVPTGP